MNVNFFVTRLACGAVLMTAAVFAVASADAATIKLKTIADAEVGERPNEDRGVNNAQLNARTSSGGDRNEIIALKFDFSSVNLAQVTGATLNLIHFRTGSSRMYNVWGVKDGSVGADNNTGTTPAQGYDDNTWDEAVVKMSTMPGLLFDGDPATQGIVVADTTSLGSGAFDGGDKGAVMTLNTPSLLSFLQTHPDNLVTVLVNWDPSTSSTGQDRFASKEATSLDGGTPTGAEGDFAPFLELNVVPEPSTLALLALAGIVAAVRPHRGGC